jgi:CheY-like chemotaxis protein
MSSRGLWNETENGSKNAGVAKSVEEAMSKSCSILIVEDDALVGKYLASILAGAGMDPVGPFSTVGDALDAIRTCIFDAGFLDVDLNGASGLQVATALQLKTIPFAFITGNALTVSREFGYVRLINKPVEPTIVLALAQELCALSLRGIDWVSPPREEVMAPLEV